MSRARLHCDGNNLSHHLESGSHSLHSSHEPLGGGAEFLCRNISRPLLPCQQDKGDKPFHQDAMRHKGHDGRAMTCEPCPRGPGCFVQEEQCALSGDALCVAANKRHGACG